MPANGPFKNKILITLMLVGLILFFISSAISVNFSSKALIDMGNNQLMSLQETKKPFCYVVSRHSIKWPFAFGGKPDRGA